MATEPKSRRRRRKKILRKNDGSLYDATERSRITLAELRDYVRDGGLFEARRQENGADCTYEVLQSVMGTGMVQNLLPGLSEGGLPGLGALSALANGGGGLAELARVLGDQLTRSGDRGREDCDEPPRRSQRRSGDRGWGNGDDWSDKPRRSKRNDPDWDIDPDWAVEPDSE